MKGVIALLLLCAAVASAKNIQQWNQISKERPLVAGPPESGPTVVDTPDEQSIGNISNGGPSVVDIPDGGPSVVDTPDQEEEESKWSEENDQNNEIGVIGSTCIESALTTHENCNQFYICAHGDPVALSCPGELLFDPESKRCEWPKSVDCGDRIIPEVSEPESTEEVQTTSAPIVTKPPPSVDTDENDSQCRFNGQILASENCNQFNLCAHGLPVTMDCPESLLFNPDIKVCDWPRNVDCGDRIIPTEEKDESDEKESAISDEKESAISEEKESEEAKESEVDVVDVIPEIEPEETDEESAPEVDENSVVSTQKPIIPETTDGDVVSTSGPLTTEAPEESDEKDESDDKDQKDESDEKDQSDEKDDNNNGVAVVDHPSNEEADDVSKSAEDDKASEEDQGAGSDDYCERRAFDGHAYPHEYCNQFYLCAHGTATPMVCPWILLFNTETRRCDWPRKVDCGDRTIPVDYALSH